MRLIVFAHFLALWLAPIVVGIYNFVGSLVNRDVTLLTLPTSQNRYPYAANDPLRTFRPLQLQRGRP